MDEVADRAGIWHFDFERDAQPGFP